MSAAEAPCRSIHRNRCEAVSGPLGSGRNPVVGLEELLGDEPFPHGFLAHGEEIETGPVHVDAEIERIDGAILAQGFFQRLKRVGGVETERVRRTGVPQLVGRERLEGFTHARETVPGFAGARQGQAAAGGIRLPAWG